MRAEWVPFVSGVLSGAVLLAGSVTFSWLGRASWSAAGEVASER